MKERKWWGVAQLHNLEDLSNKIQADMKVFLQNDANKKQLSHLRRVWRSKEAASRLEGCAMAVLIVEGVANGLTAT